ncbi:unnamed protein product [Ectocarpus sp. 12 AP-2014]
MATHPTSDVLLEGCVSANILSHSKCEYLFTATVCRAWKQNVSSVHTDLATAFETPSRIQEATETGISCNCPYTESSCDFYMEYAEIVDADVSVFQKIHEMGYEWGEFTMQNAANSHKLDVVKFMHRNGCPLTSNVLFNAVNTTYLELVEFLAEQNCPIDDTPIETRDEERFNYNIRSLERAISRNSVDIVKCLRSKLHFPFDPTTLRTACDALLKDCSESMDTLAYLHAEGCTPDADLFYDLINDGNYPAVQFMLANSIGFTRDRDSCSSALCIAINTFNSEIIRLLVEYEFAVTSDAVDLATYDMGLANWLLRVGGGPSQDCRLTSGAYINTIEYDMDAEYCLEVLDWLHEYWELPIGFESTHHLLENPRWSIALDKRDPSVAAWFQKTLH